MNTNIKRLRKELQEIRKNPEEDILLMPLEDTVTTWSAFIQGPLDSPFENGVYELAIETTPLYPMEPPKIVFVTKVFHPNVYFKDGSICLDILKREWSPAWGLKSACRAIISLLADPEADSPLNCDAGNMLRAGDLIAYHSMVKMYRIEHAYSTMPTLPLL